MQRNQILFITSLIFAIIITVFAITNSEPVTINLFFQKVIASQALVIFISAAGGAVIVSMMGSIKYIKLTMGVKKLTKENGKLKSEIEVLKTDKENESLLAKNDEDNIIEDVVPAEKGENVVSPEK